MSFNVRELPRLEAEFDEAVEQCIAWGSLRPRCRTDAFSQGCVDGTCVLFDVFGQNLGTVLEGPGDFENPPPDFERPPDPEEQ